jgi:hypothetical protein
VIPSCFYVNEELAADVKVTSQDRKSGITDDGFRHGSFCGVCLGWQILALWYVCSLFDNVFSSAVTGLSAMAIHARGLG